MGTKKTEIIVSKKEIEFAHKAGELALVKTYGVDSYPECKREELPDGSVKFTQEREPDHPIWSKIK